VSPATVSQLTSLAILGVDERRFLELLVPRCKRVAHVGRLRLVPLDEAMRALATLANDATPPMPGGNDDPGDERQPETVDDFLAVMGLRRKGAA
jgi:hypothetical protein